MIILKLHQIKTILLLMIIYNFAVSCEVEKTFTNVNTDLIIKTRTVSFDQFKKELELQDFSRNLSTSVNSSWESRSISDFTIDTTSIKVTTSSKNVYSMLAQSNTLEQNHKFYNLLVYKNADDLIVKDLVEYNPANKFEGNTNLEKYNFLMTTPSSIIYSTKTITSPICAKITYELACTCEGHSINDSQCTCGTYESVAIISWEPCPSLGNNDLPPAMDPLPSDPTNSQGGNGDSAPSETVFPTATDNPCKNMKELVQPKPDKPSIKPEIDWLKTKIDEHHEFGVEIQKNKDPLTGDWLDYTYTQKESQNANALTVNLTIGERYMASAHGHPFGISYAIPSYGDLKWLLDCYDKATSTRKEFVFAMIVCRDKNGINHVYSLNINNIINFRTKVMEIWNDTKFDGLDEEEKLKKIHREQEINLKNSNGQTEKSFLEQFKNFGFDLLEATNDNLDEWKKVELSPTATVIKVPCN